MHELLAVAGLAAAAVCLAGHLPGPVGGWGPHAVAMAVMAMMVIPGGRSGEVPLIGAAAVASACVWRVCAGCPGRGRSAAETADLAAMALLTAATAPSGTVTEHHGAGAGGLALLVAGCWAVTRAGGIMFAQLRGKDGHMARPQDAGALLMVATMTAMAW